MKIVVRTRSSGAVGRFEEEEDDDEVCDFSKMRKSLTRYSYITLCLSKGSAQITQR